MEERKEAPAHELKSVLFSLSKGVWLNILLFVLTVCSTIYVGRDWGINYKYAEVLARDPKISIGSQMKTDPEIVGLAVIYAAVLMGILLGHEMGHYLSCRYYKLNATLPYFIPAPTLIGTLGAFIKIKSPITRKHQLFDIGVAGPLISFVLSLPAIIYGISLSKFAPSLGPHEGYSFGEPLLFKVFSSLLVRDIPPGYETFPHPVAFAGWVGILVTSFNLFPVGQLDGGHVAYALLGPKSRKLARFILIVFFAMGVRFWIGWFIWGAIIFFLGLRHPQVFDEGSPLSPWRKVLGFVMIFIFILSFIPDPIRGYSLFDVLK